MKTYLLILALSSAMSASHPVANHSRGECGRLISRGRVQATQVKEETLQNKVTRLLRRAENLCRSGKRENGVQVARSAMELLK